MKTKDVNENLTKNELSILVINERLKGVLNVTSDQAIAEALGMSPSNWSNRKRVGSVPFENLVSLCISRKVNIDWLLTGNGLMKREDDSALPVVAEIDGELLAQVLKALALELAKEESARQWLTPMYLGAVGATIYNRVVFDNPAKRAEAIKEEARRTVEVWLLADKYGKLADDAMPLSSSVTTEADLLAQSVVKKGKVA